MSDTPAFTGRSSAWQLPSRSFWAFLGVGATLGLLSALLRAPLASALFIGYLVAFLAMVAYRQLARVPGLRRYLRPTQLTREGVYFVVLTLLFAAAAINTGDNLLHLLVSLLVALIAASSLLAAVSLARLQVRRKPGALYFEGVPGEMEIEVSNRKLLAPAMSISVEDASTAGGRVFFLSVAPRRTRTQSYRLVPPRRGRLVLASLRVSCRFPFGFFEKDHVLSGDAQEVVVLPRVSPLARDWLERWGHEEERSAPSLLGQDSGEDYFGVREYRAGDNPRHIHWRVTARLQKLMVREFTPPDARRVVLAVDSYLPPQAGPDEAAAVESAIRIAASLAHHYYQRGFWVGLVLPGREPLFAHSRLDSHPFLPLLELLALEDNRSLPLDEHLAQARVPPGWVIPILCGSGERAHRVLSRLPGRRSWPIFGHQETEILESHLALVPGQADPVRLQRDAG